jgi:hypothetical protein
MKMAHGHRRIFKGGELMNRLRLAAVIVIALILVAHWGLPGVARADFLPYPGEIEKLAKYTVVFLVSPLLLTLICQ